MLTSLACISSPCAYVVMEGSGISDNWILHHVVPRIASRFPRGVALVLGRALLWLVFEDSDGYLPEELQNQVKSAYQIVPGQQLAVNENPVKKVLLVVTGDEDEVHIDKLGGGDDDGDGGDATGRQMG